MSNTGQLVSDLNFYLNADEQQIDQAMTSTRKRRAVSLAYNREFLFAMTQAGMADHKFALDVTWPAQQVLFPLPEVLKQASILYIEKLTEDGRINSRISVAGSYSATNMSANSNLLHSSGGDSGVFWNSLNVLQWGNSGPPSNTYLRFTFTPDPEELTADTDVPVLIPEKFHELIVLSSAIWCKKILDGSYPGSWAEDLNNLQLLYLKYLTRGKVAGAYKWFASAPAIAIQ